MNNLTLLLVCQAVTTLGLMVFVPIMPLYIATLEQMDAAGAAHWSSLALAAPAIGTLCFAPYVGKCCDRFGYKRMLLASLVVFTASMLLMALSPGVHGFMLNDLLQQVSGRVPVDAARCSPPSSAMSAMTLHAGARWVCRKAPLRAGRWLARYWAA